MKRLLLNLPLLLSVAFLAGCSNDIKVESDVGEISVVKDSAVTKYQFDKVNADTFARKWLATWTEMKVDCYQDKYLSDSFCNEHYDGQIRKKEEDIELIKQMPSVTMLKYRTVDTNVNGDKTASGYKYVSCIPDGEIEERVKWAELIRNIDGVNAKPKKEIDNNLLNDGLVTSSVQIKVCEKYGNI